MRLRKVLLMIMLGIATLFFAFRGSSQQVLPDLPYVPTPQEVVLEMLKLAQVKDRDVVYDLGSGDGRIVITAAKLFGARGVGVDIDPELVALSNENARKAGVADRVKFFERDLFKTDLSEATVLTLYLLQELNLHLRQKLFRELKPGTRIVSHEFDMGDWKPDKVVLVPNAKFYYLGRFSHVRDANLFYWVMPADVAGEWRWSLSTPGGGRRYTLRLHQKFQEISGHAGVGKGETVLKDGRLRGEEISFTVTHEVNHETVVMRFHGRVQGRKIDGHVEIQGGAFAGKHPWTAERE